MTDAETTSACVLLTERPPAAVLMELHRALGLGVSEVLRRIEAGVPLVRAELFGNDRAEVAGLLHTVLDLVAPYRHEVHECVGDAEPGPLTRIDASILRSIIDGDTAPAGPPPRPVPDAGLTRIIAEATRAAVTDLRSRHPEHFHAFALLTTGEAFAPYLAACSVEATASSEDRWSFADSPYAVWGYEEHFGEVVRAFRARGEIFDLPDEQSLAEYALRLASMEEALRLLDLEGFFGEGADRLRVLLLAGTLPHYPEDAGSVRRLNPPGPLRDEWLREAVEYPQLPVDEETAGEPAGHAGEPAPAPNPWVAELWRAELWRTVSDLRLPDGTTVYGPHSLTERNTTFEVAEYAPGWVLVGDDSGGRGYLMRATGPEFAAVTARAGSEVWCLGLGALCPEVTAEGEFVTDDLIGWLLRRAGVDFG